MLRQSNKNLAPCEQTPHSEVDLLAPIFSSEPGGAGPDLPMFSSEPGRAGPDGPSTAYRLPHQRQHHIVGKIPERGRRGRFQRTRLQGLQSAHLKRIVHFQQQIGQVLANARIQQCMTRLLHVGADVLNLAPKAWESISVASLKLMSAGPCNSRM